jgi:hypothetical protein
MPDRMLSTGPLTWTVSESSVVLAQPRDGSSELRVLAFRSGQERRYLAEFPDSWTDLSDAKLAELWLLAVPLAEL